MIGLLLKDIYALRSYMVKQFSLLLVMYCVIAWSMRTMTLMVPMLIMALMLALISSFSLDDASHWNSYALTLPVHGREIVGEKYLLFLGGTIGGGIVFALLATLLDSVTFHEGAAAIWGSAGAILLIYCPICVVCLPLFIKFGAEKARIWMTLIFLLPFVLIMGGSSFLKEQNITLPSADRFFKWGLFALVVIVVLCYISYRISIKLFESKEY